MNPKTIASFLLAALVLLPFSAQAQSPVSVSASAFGTMWDNNVPADGISNSSANNLMNVGRYTDGTQRLDRVWFTFANLPVAPEGFEIASATLTLTLASGQSGTRTGNVTLYHSTESTASGVSASLYQDATFTSTGITAATPSTPVGGANPINLDVTQWILADYASDGGVVRSSFRLQNDSLTTTEGAYNIYVFTTNANFLPKLTLTYSPVPEPASAALALGVAGLACAFTARRRRA